MAAEKPTEPKEDQSAEEKSPEESKEASPAPVTPAQASDVKQEGLKEGQQKKSVEPVAAPVEAAELQPTTPLDLDSKKGLKEGLSRAPNLEVPHAKRTKTASDAGTLTSSKLKVHEETQLAIQGLKEGSLTEAEFWAKIGPSEKASLYKKYEWQRSKNPEAQAVWQQVRGKGSQEKKKQLLLKFIKEGVKQDGCLKQSTTVSSSSKDKELFEWVPWKQVCDWYGKEEAMARVQSGTLPVKKTGNFFEFLLVKVKSSLTTEQQKALAAEQELALSGQELKACKKALEGPKSEKDWCDIWSERRPDKHLQIEDALSESSRDSCDHSQGDDSSDQLDPATLFLKGLKEGPSSSKPVLDQQVPTVSGTEKTKKEKQELQKLEKAKARAKAKEDKAAKQNALANKWEKTVEEATQVGDRDKQSKVKKMLTLVSKGVAELKKACKKATTFDWGAPELANLTAVRDQLEDLAVDADLVEVQEKLLEAAAALKLAKTKIEQS